MKQTVMTKPDQTQNDMKSNVMSNETREAVRKLRHLYGESQEQFARRIGKTTRTVARYESDQPPTRAALAMLHQRAMLDHKDEAIKQGIAEALWNAMTSELGEVGINKISDIWSLAIQGRRHWYGHGESDFDRENIPQLLEQIISICNEIHPALAWIEEEAQKQSKAAQPKGGRKKR